MKLEDRNQEIYSPIWHVKRFGLDPDYSVEKENFNQASHKVKLDLDRNVEIHWYWEKPAARKAIKHGCNSSGSNGDGLKTQAMGVDRKTYSERF